MPTYEFRCPNGHTFDQFHKISDAPQTATCPTCGAEAARAISGGAGLVFKGSGFYLTDYGKNAHRTTGPAAGGEGKGESKSDGGAGGAKDAGVSTSAGGGGSGSSGSSSGASSSSTSGGAQGGSTGGSSGGSSSGGSSSGGAAA